MNIQQGNLLDYDYFKKYKLIAIDLSKQQVLQENEDLIQQINFIGKRSSQCFHYNRKERKYYIRIFTKSC